MIDLARLGPAARKQIAAQLTKPPKPPEGHTPGKFSLDQLDSNGERYFYLEYILPLLHGGKLKSWTWHKSFPLYPPGEYCGQKLPGAVYTPDFLLEYQSGTVEVIEIKSKFTRRKSRDYTLRRRLFIDKYCRPQGWLWREIVTDKETKA